MAQSLTFTKVSDNPTEFLHLQRHGTRNPSAEEVSVQMLAAPINPQDLMVMRGKYPVKPEYNESTEAIPGYDGVALVLECGDGVELIRPGDHVIPKRHGLGTWRTHAVLKANSLIKVSSTVDPRVTAILKMCVTPAYLLLEDMRTLKPGDWIIQNAASGTIAQMVSQFARLKGLHSISIIRDREDFAATESLKEILRDRGADLVMTETELSNADTPLHKNKRIVLALDAVFGRPAAKMAVHLSPNATFVNYGSLGVGASSGAFELTQELIFWKQIRFRNFRLSACLGERSEDEVTDMLTWFVELFDGNLLKTPDVESVSWDAHQQDLERHLVGAVERAQSRNVGGAKKKLFVFQS